MSGILKVVTFDSRMRRTVSCF